MDPSENKPSTQKGNIIRPFPPKIRPPAVGKPATFENISAKQTAASAVPAIGNSKNLQKTTENSYKKYAPDNFTPVNYNISLHTITGFTTSGALQTNSWPRVISFADLYIKMREDNNTRVITALHKTNPGYEKDDQGLSLNCAFCALVFVRLLRGEDYAARPLSADNKKYMNLDTLLTVMKNPPNLEECKIRVESKEHLIKTVKNKMEEAGEGAVAVIGIPEITGWDNGHLYNAVQVNDSTWTVDAQRHMEDITELYDSVPYPQEIIFFLANDIEFTDEFDTYIGINFDNL